MLVSSSRSMWINNIIDRIKLPFRKEKELFSALYTILGFYPHNIEYYKQALMHIISLLLILRDWVPSS